MKKLTIAIALSSALILTACGKSSDTEKTASATPAPASTQSASENTGEAVDTTQEKSAEMLDSTKKE
jgi:major membrane immunogen (membrane-anchored lipoprotein)